MRPLALLALLLSGCAALAKAPGVPTRASAAERGRAYTRDPPPEPTLTVPIVAFRVADDDGQNAARITPEEVAHWLTFTNEVFHAAGVRFDFQPGEDFRDLRNTIINRLHGTEQEDWAEAKHEADDVASRFPDRLVIFFRHGPGTEATGAAFSWFDYNFVAMPGWLDDEHCGHDHIDALAHELGHHLGLPHTFARVFPTAADAEAFLSRNPLQRLDGDGLADTPPDPGIRTTECQDIATVTLGGVPVALPRRNVMSYYDERDSFSPQQIDLVRWFARERLAWHMKLPKNGSETAMEAESLRLVRAEGCRPRLQKMEGFGVGNFSGGAQVFCHTRGPASVTAVLPVKTSGRYRITLYATRAPDYGVLEVLIDGQPLGPAYDAWAPRVLASGAIPLGERTLAAGDHEIVFRAASKNAASTDFHLGIDAIDLRDGTE